MGVVDLEACVHWDVVAEGWVSEGVDVPATAAQLIYQY